MNSTELIINRPTECVSPETMLNIIRAHHCLDNIEKAIDNIAKRCGHPSMDEFFSEKDWGYGDGITNSEFTGP